MSYRYAWTLALVGACGASTVQRDPPGRESALAAGDAVHLWEGGAELRSVIDDTRGLLVLRYCGTPSEADPPCEASAYLHCGESLVRATRVLQEDLEMRQNYSDVTSVYRCQDGLCRHQALMDGDHQGTLRFDESGSSAILVEVLHIVGHMSPDEENAAHVWVTTQRNRFQTQRCGSAN